MIYLLYCTNVFGVSIPTVVMYLLYLLYRTSVLSIPLMVDVFDVFAILHQCAAGWWMIGCDRSVASHKEALSGLLTQIYSEAEKKIWQIYFVERSPYTDILWKDNLTNIFGNWKENSTNIFWDFWYVFQNLSLNWDLTMHAIENRLKNIFGETHDF